MDIGKGLMTTLTFTIWCYLHPPSATAHARHTCTYTQNQHIGGRLRSCVGQVVMYLAHYLQDQDDFPSAPLSYLPVLVRTMKALAQDLKDDSTAPTATASEGSLVRWECLLSSSNSCLWKVAASASRAI